MFTIRTCLRDLLVGKHLFEMSSTMIGRLQSQALLFGKAVLWPRLAAGLSVHATGTYVRGISYRRFAIGKRETIYRFYL
jgi:hypothetical protein